jgi:hypothetical protein
LRPHEKSERRWLHKITRPRIDEHNLYGFVLKTSGNLTLIAPEYDFCIDGYRIIRNDDIAVCKPTPTTRYGTRLMEKEGLTPDAEIASQIDLTDWFTALLDLKRMAEFVIVENEGEGDFLIGPIRRANKKSVTINHFDSRGRWTEPRGIGYGDITSVTFRSRYINIYRKYIKKV